MVQDSNATASTSAELVIEELQPVKNGAQIERRTGGRPVGQVQGDGLDRNVWSLLGTPLDAVTMGEAVGYVDRAIRTEQKLWLATPNLDWMCMSQEDTAFHRSVIRSDLSVCDGMPVMLLARLAGVPLRTRVPGSGLFTRLRQVRPSFLGARSVFFFGGRDGTAEKATAALASENGGVIGIGAHNPGFGSIEEMSQEATLSVINERAPDLLIVSLSARKGQLWIAENIGRIKAKVIAPLGAVVDFTAGTIQRAPAWMQKTGLEWLWRIKEDPQLAKRYAHNFAVLPGFILRCLLIRALSSHRNSKVKSIESHQKTTFDEATATVYIGTDTRGVNLRSVRVALRAGLQSGKAINISFAANEAFDMALIGLLQLAEDQATQNGNGLFISGLDKLSQMILTLTRTHIKIKDPDIHEEDISTVQSSTTNPFTQKAS